MAVAKWRMKRRPRQTAAESRASNNSKDSPSNSNRLAEIEFSFCEPIWSKYRGREGSRRESIKSTKEKKLQYSHLKVCNWIIHDVREKPPLPSALWTVSSDERITMAKTLSGKDFIVWYVQSWSKRWARLRDPASWAPGESTQLISVRV